MIDYKRQSWQWQRHEVKYLITEKQAADIRRYCITYLAPDPHALGRPRNEYPISSVYLDSPARTLLHDTLERKTDRFKLRIRSYRWMGAPLDDSEMFSEIKYKKHGIVTKTRAQLTSELSHGLLDNDFSIFRSQGLNVQEAKGANEFLALRHELRATPAVGIFYIREAYESTGAQRVRITLDRNLHFGTVPDYRRLDRERWWPANLEGVILEVKFTNTYPFWVADMLRRVEINRRGVCKYVICSRSADNMGLGVAG